MFSSLPSVPSASFASTWTTHSKWKVSGSSPPSSTHSCWLFFLSFFLSLLSDIEITRKANDGKITKLFFDPTGRHLIITTDREENYYLYEKWRRTKQLNKLKGMTITSIGWNKQATLADPSTREILIGTKKGLIYETVLEPTDEFFRREERYLEQIYSIHESTMPITGLHFEQFPVNNRKYFVMATTPTRIYQFVGFIGAANGNRPPATGFGDVSEERGEKAIFGGLFSKYQVNPGKSLVHTFLAITYSSVSAVDRIPRTTWWTALQWSTLFQPIPWNPTARGGSDICLVGRSRDLSRGSYLWLSKCRG